MPALDIRIIALEALKQLTTRSLTKSTLTVSTWEHSMSLSRRFLQMKENQNFPQITRIWLKNWHLWSKIKLWCIHRLTNAILFSIFSVLSPSNYVGKHSEILASTRNEIWPWNTVFQGQQCFEEFYNYFLRIQNIEFCLKHQIFCASWVVDISITPATVKG